MLDLSGLFFTRLWTDNDTDGIVNTDVGKDTDSVAITSRDIDIDGATSATTSDTKKDADNELMSFWHRY